MLVTVGVGVDVAVGSTGAVTVGVLVTVGVGFGGLPFEAVPAAATPEASATSTAATAADATIRGAGRRRAPSAPVSVREPCHDPSVPGGGAAPRAAAPGADRTTVGRAEPAGQRPLISCS